MQLLAKLHLKLTRHEVGTEHCSVLYGAGKQNPKFEYRNPKQIPIDPLDRYV